MEMGMILAFYKQGIKSAVKCDRGSQNFHMRSQKRQSEMEESMEQLLTAGRKKK
jgi:hypothetical protein